MKRAGARENPQQEITGDRLVELLDSTGVVLFRDVAQNVEDFSQCIRSCSSQVVCDPARARTGQASLVDAGKNAVGLHLENGTFSREPDMCWFFCETAPESGSQTTICDGEAVWERLSDETRKYFLSTKIKFTRTFAEGQWRRFVSLYYPEAGSPEDVTEEDLLKWALDCGGQIFTLQDCGAVLSEYTVGAVRISRFSGRLAFANSLFTPSFNYTPPRISQANGEEIPREFMEEAREQTEECTTEIEWQDGDMVVMDNTRVMHGRRAIESKKRKIFNTLSYL